MEVGGEVKRGKVKPDTIILFLLSLAILGIGITFILAPLAAEPYSIGERFVRVLGIIAIVAGTGCATNCWDVIRHELYPSN